MVHYFLMRLETYLIKNWISVLKFYATKTAPLLITTTSIMNQNFRLTLLQQMLSQTIHINLIYCQNILQCLYSDRQNSNCLLLNSEKDALTFKLTSSLWEDFLQSTLDAHEREDTDRRVNLTATCQTLQTGLTRLHEFLSVKKSECSFLVSVQEERGRV